MLATETVIGGRYRLGSVIGRGGGADVYRADDLEDDRPVAVKVLRAANHADLRRFELEAQTLARLDHPAIVRMTDDGEHDGVPYLVLDLIDGEPLSETLQRGPLPEGEVIRIGIVLADALAHAHALGIVHRDVKPGNVLFDRDGGVHLTDFGIARLTDVTAITATGFVIGTAAYLAPEQVTGEPAGPASDVYALGLVLAEALTGERAYTGSPSEAALARLHRPPHIPGTVNRSVSALLGAMTAFEPAPRPTAAAVADALRLAPTEAPADATALLPVASDETSAIPIPIAAAPAPIAPHRGALSSRHALLAVLAAACVALVILISSVGGNSSRTPANAQTSTTIAPTTAPTTSPTTAPPAPTTRPQKHKGKGDG